MREGGNMDRAAGGKTTAGGQTDPFISELQKKLLSEADMVSSEDTNLEAKIGEAIKNVQTSTQKGSAAIASASDREMTEAARQAGLDRVGVQEGSAGFATSTALLKDLDIRTEKSLRDLDQRKQELILANDAQGAAKVAELQLKEIEFQQAARQRTFQNLLSLGSFGLQVNQESRLARAQTFTENQAISNVALRYGITVQDGDTIETITARAAPFASEEQQLELAKVRSDITRNNAEIARIQREASEGNVTSTDIDAIAEAYASLEASQGADAANALLGSVKGADMQSKVILKAAEKKALKLKAEEEAAKAASASRGGSGMGSLPDALTTFGFGLQEGSNSLAEWLTGIKRAR